MNLSNASKSIVIAIVSLNAIVVIQTAKAGDRNDFDGSGGNLITSVPRTMSYQGILQDSGGDPVTDSVYIVTFRIYDVESGGTSLWNETLPCTTSTGLFTAVFSNVNIPFDEDYWLELEVGGEILDPRQKMSMVGYAARADTADFALLTAAGGNGWIDEGGIVRLETVTDSVGIGTAAPAEKLHLEGNLFVSDKATIGPGNSNIGTNAFVTGRNNTVSANFATVGGGEYDTASGANSTIGGGSYNTAGGINATIAGGGSNFASGDYTAIGGGVGNTSDANRSVVGGGDFNTASGMGATVSGGGSNSATNTRSVVGGGYHNSAEGQYSLVAGGYTDTASGEYATVGGGNHNIASGNWSFAGGGYLNFASGHNSSIGGGSSNDVIGDYTTVSGGRNNSIGNFTDGTIGGGRNNIVSGELGTIAGGYGNNAEYYSSIGGGAHNTATGMSFVGGGEYNNANTEYATVAGGADNTATEYCTVGGGYHNDALYDGCTISGGKHNTNIGFAGTISGGVHNYVSGDYAYLAGGYADSVSGDHAAIGGGLYNNAIGNFSIICGGDSNTATGNSSAIGGGGNNASGNDYDAVFGGNYNQTSGGYSAICGGLFDTVAAVYGGVMSGYDNTAGDELIDTSAFVGGGFANIAKSRYSSVCAGKENAASGNYSHVGGGLQNRADATASVVSGGGINEINAPYSCIPGGINNYIDVGADVSLVFGYGNYISGAHTVSFFNEVEFGRLGLNRDDNSGGINNPIQVGTNIINGNGAYLSPAGLWHSTSSKNKKENYIPFERKDLFSKIKNLEVESWQYIGSKERHIGPYAEDFTSAFGTGSYDLDGNFHNDAIAGNDVAGVALAGVKELIQENRELRDLISQLERRIEELEKR